MLGLIQKKIFGFINIKINMTANKKSFVFPEENFIVSLGFSCQEVLYFYQNGKHECFTQILSDKEANF